MRHEPAATDIHALPYLPEVRKITFTDLRDALEKGLDDFKYKPSHVFILAIIYPIIGFILGRLTFGHDLLPLFYPLAAGFVLLGPLAAIGFYEISRARERGADISWEEIITLTRAKSRGAILAFGALLIVIFFVWVLMARAIYEDIFGSPVTSVEGFLYQVFETPGGLRLMIIGNAVGFLFALVIFSISVVSFPLLVDKDVSAPVAIVTSLRAVFKNPVTMAAWALFIAAAMFVGSLPFLLGLMIVLPVLGHASWHVYRKMVVA
jgi:uncharacterized membrane protein